MSNRAAAPRAEVVIAALLAASLFITAARRSTTAATTSLAALADPTVALTLAGQLGGPMRAVAADPARGRVYLGTGPAVTVLDARVPTTITTVAKSIPLGGEVRQLALNDGGGVLSAVLADGAVVLLDVAGIDGGAQPEVAARWPAAGTGTAEHVLWLQARYVVVADGEAGLAIVDAADPRAPREVGRFTEADFGPIHQAAPAPVAAGAQVVAVAAGSAGLLLVDVTDVTRPTLLGKAAVGDAIAVATTGSGRLARAYVAIERRGSGDIGLQYVDIHQPATPRWPTTPSPFGRPVGRSLIVHDQVLYTCGQASAGLRAFTLVEPASPKSIDPEVDEPLWQSCTDVAVLDPAAGRLVTAAWEPDVGPYATGHAGIAVLDVALPSKPAVSGAVNLRGNPNDFARDAGTVWIADGWYRGNAQYGPRIVDIADERRPMQTARVPSSWRHYPNNIGLTFWTADGAALDGGAFILLSAYLARYEQTSPLTAPAATSVGGSPGRMAVVGGRAIIPSYGHATGVLYAYGLHPSPSLAAVAVFPDAQTPRAVDGAPAGTIAVVADDPTARTASLRLVDPPPPGTVFPGPAVVERGRVALPYGPPPPLSEQGRRGWGTYGVTVDGGRAFVANGTDGLRIADVADPTAPRLIGHLDHARARVIDVSRDWNAPAGGSNRIATLAVTGGDPDGAGSSGPTPFLAAAADGQTASTTRAAGSAAEAPGWESTVRVIDVTDPTAPHIVAEYRFDAQGRRVRLEGDRVLLTDTEATLRILRLGPAAPPTMPATSTPGGTPGGATPSATATDAASSTPTPRTSTTVPTATSTASAVATSTAASTAIPSTPPRASRLLFPITLKLGAAPVAVVLVVDRSPDGSAAADPANGANLDAFRALAAAALARLDPRVDSVGVVAFDRTAAVLVPAGSRLETADASIATLDIAPPGLDQGRLDLGLEAAIASIDRLRAAPGGDEATPIVLLLAVGRVDDPVRRARLAVKADALAALGGQVYAAVVDAGAVAMLEPLAGADHVIAIDRAGDPAGGGALDVVERWAAAGWRARRW